MFMAPSLPLDIFKITLALKNTNAVGYDSISTKILKAVAGEICHPLSHIINLCISEGIFPEALKKSVIQPLFKKQDRELMEYYRPIALIPIISKIFENYIYKELSAYLEANKILCNEQKGFRKQKTINMAIYDFLQNVIINMDNNKPICAIFCDMTQAFDYVQHSILFKKLDAYGVRGNVLDLLQSYLRDRKQVTEISRINIETKKEERVLSGERKDRYGVPQGSVLGPPLFTLYINDLPLTIEHPMTLFADDSTISIPCNRRDLYKDDITNTLIRIIEWLENNNLKINLNKTVIIHFSQRTMTFPNFDITYKNNIIDTVNTTTFLGLTIDRNLNWKAHIDILSKRISSNAFALNILARTVNTEALLTSYYGLTESILRYGVIFWGNSTNKEIVFRAQKRCIRAMFRLKTTDSCKPYFIQHKILTLPSLYILETIVFIRNNPELFPRMSDQFPRNRRDQSQLCLRASRTAFMRKSVLCMAPTIYNKLPKSWREHNNTVLKTKLKLFLTSKAYYNINEFMAESFTKS